MSKLSTRISHDWRALLQDMREAGPTWEDSYVHALQKSLEGRKHDALLALLDAEAPLHPRLLPVLADVIRDARQGLATGKGSGLTAHQDDIVRWFFDAFTADDGGMLVARQPGVTGARAWIADRMKVSTDTIKRSLKRTAGKK